MSITSSFRSPRLGRLAIMPYIAALREAQNYVRAYTRGLGIFELPE